MDIRVWYVMGYAWCVPAALWSLCFVEDAGEDDEHGFSITGLCDTSAVVDDEEAF